MNLYAYVGGDPVNAIDPMGLFTLADARVTLRQRNEPMNIQGLWPRYSDTQVFNEWHRLERNSREWIDNLTPCPKKIDVCDKEPINPDNSLWEDPSSANPEHVGAEFEMRSHATSDGASNQCSYDSNGNIVTGIPAGGTADRAAMAFPYISHFNHDLEPWWLAKKLNRRGAYYNVRPEVIAQ